MELSHFWLIPVSLSSCCFLFLLLERFLIKWFCRTFLHNRVQLVGHQKEDEALRDGVKTITEGDVTELSLLVLTWLMGGMTSVVGLVAILETMHDSLHARSVVLVPWAHIASWYYIVDTYGMFGAFIKRRNMIHRRIKAKLILFVLDKWPFLVHHIILIVIGYPIVVNEQLRSYKGDFYAAVLFVQDMSNPFLANAKIINILGMTNSTFYTVNGAILILVFLVVRVLNVPLSLLFYSAQYHEWGVTRTLMEMRWPCYVCSLIQFLLQLYWFVLLVQLARGVVGGWRSKELKSGTEQLLLARTHRHT